MTQQPNHAAPEAAFRPPALRLTPQGEVEMASLADAMQWFLDYDERVAVVRAPQVEEIFQWKQSELLREDASAYAFPRAEDRFAVGVMQALAENGDERRLHAWLGHVLEALQEAAKLNEEITNAFKLDAKQSASALAEAAKLPSETARAIFLNACWLEALCTAEARVLGWFYQELYGRPYNPQNF
jgi:hypothetical protein